MYVYEETEKGVFTVGIYTEFNVWTPISDHPTKEAAADRVAYLNGENPGSCTWTQKKDGHWLSDCGLGFSLTFESPKDNDMHFCCKCGKVLKEKLIEPKQSNNEQIGLF